jgi:hypothetical protein
MVLSPDNHNGNPVETPSRANTESNIKAQKNEIGWVNAQLPGVGKGLKSGTPTWGAPRVRF